MDKDTDQPESSKGAGDSQTRRGEDVSKQHKEAGRHDKDPKGESQRPRGGSEARDKTGIDPKEPIDPESPDLLGS